MRFIIAISLLSMLYACAGGCTSMEYPRAHTVSLDDNHQSISYTADLRGTHVFKVGENYWVLSEPPPDAAFSYDTQEGLDVSLFAFGSSEGGGESIGSGSEDLPLTGRAPYVLLARELFFRVNEMAFNTRANYDQYFAAFKEVLTVVKEIAKIEATNVKYTAEVKVNTGATASLGISGKMERTTDRKETADESLKDDIEDGKKKPGATPEKKKDSSKDDSSDSGDSSSSDDSNDSSSDESSDDE